MFSTAYMIIFNSQLVEIWYFDFSTNRQTVRQTDPQTLLPIEILTRSLKITR